jgi:hypothetical protein
MDALSHWKPRIPCETCDKVFLSQAAVDQHMSALGHYRNYCKDCGRHFLNENNMRMVGYLDGFIYRTTSLTGTASKLEDSPWKKPTLPLLRDCFRHCERVGPPHRERRLPPGPYP